MTASSDTLSVLVRAFDAGKDILGNATANVARWRHAVRETDDFSLPHHTIAMLLQPCTFYRARGGSLAQGPGHVGGLGVLPKGVYGSWRFRSAEHQVLHVYLHPSQLKAVSEEQFDPRQSDLQERLGLEDPVVAAVMAALDGEIGRDDPNRLYMDTLTTCLSAHVLRHYVSGISLPRHEGGLAAWQVARIREAMASQLARNHSLAELASLLGLSPYHFCRAFRRATGMSPHRYQITLRIERAKDLLAHGTMSIADVSAAVGYDDQGCLARLFRQEVGMSPSRYRRELRRPR